MSSYNPSNGSIFRTEYPEKTAPNNEAIIMNNDTMEIYLITRALLRADRIWQVG